jgi:hypothetical protein
MTSDTTTALAVVGIILVIVVLLTVGYIWFLIWIWKDCQKYGEEALPWTLGAAFLFVIILPFYFSARVNGKAICGRCSKWFPIHLPNCPHCGSDKNANR